MHVIDRIRLASPSEIDALIGTRILGETPAVYWEHADGLFHFETEAEAWEALGDPYYQLFLPKVNWATTQVREVQQFSAYSSDAGMIWKVIGKVSLAHGPLHTREEAGRWRASFGAGKEAEARTPLVAICLAALQACGLILEVDHDAIDAALNRLAAAQSANDIGVDRVPDEAGREGA